MNYSISYVQKSQERNKKMIGNYNPDKIKQLMLKTINNSDFVENLIKDHQGDEEAVLKIIQDTFAELLKDSTPFIFDPVTPHQITTLIPLFTP